MSNLRRSSSKRACSSVSLLRISASKPTCAALSSATCAARAARCASVALSPRPSPTPPGANGEASSSSAAAPDGASLLPPSASSSPIQADRNGADPDTGCHGTPSPRPSSSSGSGGDPAVGGLAAKPPAASRSRRAAVQSLSGLDCLEVGTSEPFAGVRASPSLQLLARLRKAARLWPAGPDSISGAPTETTWPEASIWASRGFFFAFQSDSPEITSACSSSPTRAKCSRTSSRASWMASSRPSMTPAKARMRSSSEGTTMCRTLFCSFNFSRMVLRFWTSSVATSSRTCSRSDTKTSMENAVTMLKPTLTPKKKTKMQ
mmetsp:Transcript_77160/g.220976  ORF Transcript_77160/g.220976 Transcript_77160/m.220976 type:complete len:319 (+) Transcript_77160:745-1701(+)